MRPNKTKATSILVVLLVYVVIAGNTSGEIALCVGADGHIALEPVIHERCENLPHIEQNESPSIAHEHEGHLESPHCKPCIDIPIFIGPASNRLVLKPAKPDTYTHDCLLETEVISNNSFILPGAPLQFYLAKEENRFLSSIILLV
jgi:hypothetical protein